MDFLLQNSTLVLSTVASLLAFAVFYYHVKVFSYWSSRGIKGPRPWPLFGTQIYYMFKTKIEVDLEWTEKYGKVYGIYEGYLPTLRVTDHELIKYIFVKEFSKFTDRNTQFNSGENIKRWLFFSKGDHWNNQRVLITPLFTSLRMKTMFDTMLTCVNYFIKEVNGKLANSDLKPSLPTNEESKPSQTALVAKKAGVFTKSDLMSFTLDVIGKTFFGLDLHTYRDKRSEFHKRAFAFAEFDVLYTNLYFLLPSFVRNYFQMDLIRPCKYEFFDKLNKVKIEEKRKHGGNSGKQIDFVQYLLDAELPHDNSKEANEIYTAEDDNEAHFNNKMNHKELEAVHRNQGSKSMKFRKFDDIEINAQMTFFFLAGFETTSSSTGLVIYELSHHPELQEQVYQEVLAEFQRVGGEKFEHASLANLKLLDAFMSETLRLNNPITEFSRCVTSKEGVTLPTNPPLYLPLGSTLSTPGFVVHRDPDYWPEPDKFDITRFQAENKANIKACTYMPFGLGPRNCVGMRFALMTIKLVLANILLNYKILPGPKSAEYPPKFNQHGFFTQLKHTDFTLIPRQE